MTEEKSLHKVTESSLGARYPLDQLPFRMGAETAEVIGIGY